MGEEPITPESLIPVMLKSSTGWDQVAAFNAAILRKKMEGEWKWQTWKTTVNQHTMSDLTVPPYLPIVTPNQKLKTTQGCCHIQRAAHEHRSPGFIVMGDYSHVHRNGENGGRKIVCPRGAPPSPDAVLKG